jgi:hypothetical protein
MRHFILSALILVGCETEGISYPDYADQECSDFSCITGVEVFFSAMEWRDGTYTLDLEVDETQVVCTVNLPVDENIESIDCGEGIWLGVDRQDGLWGLHLDDDDLEYLRVSLSTAEQVMGEIGFAPDYRNIRPNGDECPGHCAYASETIDVRGMM